MISLADQERRIEQGALSPEAALAESLAAIDAKEKTIGAFVRRAKNPRAQDKGPLRGIAVGIKDIVDTADMPTEMGCVDRDAAQAGGRHDRRQDHHYRLCRQRSDRDA
jgi:Asp-tRNA(Asn)/Glu-tRNA(Gln) amidotransferase A subunit family amidase